MNFLKCDISILGIIEQTTDTGYNMDEPWKYAKLDTTCEKLYIL